ncbi:hypothetical protein ISN45_Aa07g008730 [Arabidopsis thaliana x Arabidopsis arenosa]|uniref:Beta-1,3-N-Acetylglucosaminyltransferase family protein n=1 Tax=Arabidopsis thaliana x Arabidopsis arenosa TaxID=1240361 RepID=A0A8T1Y2B2_9BRAS|nr:hypothetical protein ISN45_Aa07g008730 [Arabidopsis thaliana x Arabidopsis arenosa]
MASNACKLISLVLFFAFVNQGYGDCHLNYLSVKQSKTGNLVQNKPEWEVRVTNPCKCKFQYTTLSCVGFQSVTPVATSLLSKSGDLCLLNAGKFIFPHVDFVFKYVWDTSFDLKVIDGVIVCP